MSDSYWRTYRGVSMSCSVHHPILLHPSHSHSLKFTSLVFLPTLWFLPPCCYPLPSVRLYLKFTQWLMMLDPQTWFRTCHQLLLLTQVFKSLVIMQCLQMI